MVLVFDVAEVRETKVLDQACGRKEGVRVEPAGVQDADFQFVLGGILGLANGKLKSPEK